MSKYKGDDVDELVEHDELEQQIQPHLQGQGNGVQGHATSDVTVSLEYINPALVDTGTSNAAAELPHGETGENGTVGSSNGVTGSKGQQMLSANTPVVYSAAGDGEGQIITEPVVIRQANGIHVIRTRRCCEHIHDPNRIRVQERPLKLKQIKYLKAFSIVAAFLFFPLGIAAMYTAYKCEKKFHEGIMQGNIDLAKKLAKRCERLIIFSVMGALLVAVAVFAIIERNLMEHDDEYWKSRSNNRILPAG